MESLNFFAKVSYTLHAVDERAFRQVMRGVSEGEEVFYISSAFCQNKFLWSCGIQYISCKFHSCKYYAGAFGYFLFCEDGSWKVDVSVRR